MGANSFAPGGQKPAAPELQQSQQVPGYTPAPQQGMFGQAGAGTPQTPPPGMLEMQAQQRMQDQAAWAPSGGGMLGQAGADPSHAQMIGSLLGQSGGIGAGADLMQAMQRTAPQAPPPMQQEMARLAVQPPSMQDSMGGQMMRTAVDPQSLAQQGLDPRAVAADPQGFARWQQGRDQWQAQQQAGGMMPGMPQPQNGPQAGDPRAMERMGAAPGQVGIQGGTPDQFGPGKMFSPAGQQYGGPPGLARNQMMQRGQYNPYRQRMMPQQQMPQQGGWGGAGGAQQLQSMMQQGGLFRGKGGQPMPPKG